MNADPDVRITELLQAIRSGEKTAWNELMPAVYDELKRLASRRLARWDRRRAIQTTELVHETYAQIVRKKAIEWVDRRHFFNVAAQAMRALLIDEARRRERRKRGGDWTRIALDEELRQGAAPTVDVLALDEALRKLEAEDPEQHQIVMLRYFAGLCIDETATALGVSSSTVDRQWRFARAWLRRELG